MKDLIRFLEIVHIFLKARIDKLIVRFTSPGWGFISLTMPWKIYSSKEPDGDRLSSALEQAGPIFIKFGQLLSTRPDLIPKDIAKSLSKLQDNLAPFSTKIAIEIIQDELGKSIDQVFTGFTKVPIAAASIAQVYEANLKESGKEVAIKVVRPNLEEKITKDLSLMRRLAKIIENNFSDTKRLRLIELLEEYKHIIKDELDLRIEASNMKKTKEHFKNNSLLYVPKVYSEFTTKNLLIMERVSGTPVDQIENLKNSGVDLKLLSERGVEIFLKQVFTHNFFHADMHPGNIFINTKDPNNPTYIAVDYAIIGSLTEEEQFQIGRMLLALIGKDFKEIAEILIGVNWVNPRTNPNELERTIRVACEPFLERPLEEIKFGELLLHIFDSARRFDLQMQPSLMLLQKTLINIEGLGKQLYPKLDFWSIASPFLKSWLSEKYNPTKIKEWTRKNALEWLEKARKFPRAAESALNQLNKLEQYHLESEKKQEEFFSKMKKEKRFSNILILIMLMSVVFFGIYRVIN